MSLEAQAREELLPCRQCQSPVFDDELYCEVCGARAPWTADEVQSPVARQAADREEHDADVVAAVSDRGNRRPRNEDATAVAAAGDRFVAVVCDGVASTANSDQAARAAAAASLSVLEPLLYSPDWPATVQLTEILAEAFEEAQRAVTQVPEDETDGSEFSPSTTLVVAVGSGAHVAVGNVGDSRAYWLSADRVHGRVLTVDDSYAGERIAEGVDPKDAYAHPDAHTITRWIGGDADSVIPTVATFDVTEAGFLVVCTDGLWNYFDDPGRLAGVVPEPAPSPLELARLLTDAALRAGGHDNITVAVVPLDPSGPSVLAGRAGEGG
jgi:serine/threonine protein phosphatase PrpC